MLIISSNNNDLSWVLSKNPSTGMLLRQIRQGVGQGWFRGINTYCLNFIDGRKSNSYSKDDFAYLDHSSISHPQMYLDLINKLLPSTIKKIHDKDVDEVCSVTITNLCCSPTLIGRLRALNQLVDGIVIDVEPINNGALISIRSNGIRQSLIWAMALLFIALPKESYIESAAINKIISLVGTLDIPYYLAYLIRNRLIRRGYNNKAMDNLLVILNKAANTTLSPVSNLDVRINYIKASLSDEPIILDIGCGEGNYQFLSKRSQYIPIEKNIDLHSEFMYQARRKGLDVITPLTSLDDYDWPDKPHLVILSEVLEHNSFDEAMNLLDQVLSKPQTNRVLVTLPNRDFNQFFGIDGYRHEDHKWELDRTTLRSLLLMIKDHTTEVSYLGDRYQNESMTIGILYKRVENHV